MNCSVVMVEVTVSPVVRMCQILMLGCQQLMLKDISKNLSVES